MLAIFKKELRNYFKTPLAYIFIAPFFALAAMFFVNGVTMYQIATVEYVLNSINIICLFVVPILTMQLLSEERNKKTDQLLITAPISVTDIVAGKYLSALAVFSIAFVLTLVFPVILCFIGSPVLSEMVSSYVGFYLMWASFIAIGLFISSLTESQVISAILTFVVLLVLYSMDSWAASIPIAWIKTTVSWFSVLKRYSDFQIGLISIPDVLYYLSFIFVFLFLTHRNIEKRRFS